MLPLDLRQRLRRVAPVGRGALPQIGRQLLDADRRLPARQDLPADSLPPWVRDVRQQMNVADVDWDMLAQRGAEWMRYWDENVRGKGK